MVSFLDNFITFFSGSASFEWKFHVEYSGKKPNQPGMIWISVKSHMKPLQSSVYVTSFNGSIGSKGAAAVKRISMSMNTLTWPL